jgi:cytochrome d ubiquinol oxidase subunit I
MLLASYLTGAFCVAATGAWYVLRKEYHAESRIMLRMGLGLAAVLMPIQLFFGHLNGIYVNTYQSSKMAAIEGRWNDEKPAGEVLFAWPDVENRRNRFAITLPSPFGSLIDSDSLTAGETGLNNIPPENWPPIAIPFFAFRIMVGCGLLMLGLAWLGSYLSYRHRLAYNRPLLWLTFLSFPLPFVAIITGWFTAEVGRQPWVVYGVLRTADAVTPFLTTREATISLVIFCLVYAFIFLFGTFYIYRLIRIGPMRKQFEVPHLMVPNRPMSLADEEPIEVPSHITAGE